MGMIDRELDWAMRLPPGLRTIEHIAHTTYTQLPKVIREMVGALEIRVKDFPDERTSEHLGLETPFDILGLFEGSGAKRHWNPSLHLERNRLTIFRRALLDYWCENDERLGEIIRHIIVNEIANHYDIADDEITRIEMEA